MPDVVQIGPLQLQGKLVALLVACVFGFWLMRRVIRQGQRNAQESGMENRIEEMILNAALIVFFTWRLGSLLTQPSLMWKSPMKLLLTSGGNMEILLGILLAGLYLTFQMRKSGMGWRVVLDGLAVGAAAAIFMYAALTPTFGLPTKLPWGIGVEGTVSRFHPVHAYLAVLLLPLLVWQQQRAARSKIIEQGELLKYALLYGGAAGMVASFFAVAEPAFLYLSTQQLMYLLMLVAGMILPILSHTTGRRELMDMSNNDSKTQIQQDQQNQERAKAPAGKEGYVDKKLDGPNRPST